MNNWKPFRYRDVTYSFNVVAIKSGRHVKIFAPREAYGAHIYVYANTHKLAFQKSFPPNETEIQLANAVRIWMGMRADGATVPLIAFLEKMFNEGS